MAELEKVIKGLIVCVDRIPGKYSCNECPYEIDGNDCEINMTKDVLSLLKEQEAKQYNNHEVACIIADLFGDPCACNFNDIDTWLPYKCDFRETCCPNPVGVACWEQYLKHKEGR